MRKIVIALMCVGTVWTTSGCDKGAETGADASGSAAPAAAGASGLTNPGNNAEVVAAAKKVMTCTWKPNGFDYKCEELKAWKKSELLKKGKNDDTLVNFLADDDEKVRYLGALGLGSFAKKALSDKELGKIIVTKLDTEKSAVVVKELARTVGRLDLAATGQGDKVLGMIADHKNQLVRESLTNSSVLFTNRKDEKLYGLFVKLAKGDKNKVVRKNAAGRFWTGTPTGKRPEVCKLWAELADDADRDLAGHSAYHAAFWSNGDCMAEYDGLLSLIEKRANAGTIESSMTAAALKYLYGQKKATAGQKAKALAVAKALAKNEKNKASARADALQFVAKEDPAGKTFAAGFLNDKEFFVKSAAKRIKDGK